MTEKDTNVLLCPFCGAPYRKFIPANTVQLKCQYCGGVFLIPPQIGGAVPRCLNHFDRVAIGICNDCGESFCGSCLHIYALKEKNVNATLYLCPTCLRRKHVREANEFIFLGFAFLFFGVLNAINIMPFGALAMIFGILAIIMGISFMLYGISRRSAPLEGSTIDELRAKKEKIKVKLAEMKDADVEEIYNELLTKYIARWGVASGTELLDSEIAAYTRHGISFPEAVIRVYQRQHKPL